MINIIFQGLISNSKLSSSPIKFFILSLLFLLVLNNSFSQDTNKEQVKEEKPKEKQFYRDTIPTLDLSPDTVQETSKKKKKKKKKVFYGLKCKKGFTKKGRRKKQVIETFFYLKEFKLPDPYIKDLYVWELKTRKVIEIDEIKEEDKNKYKILHGPYKRTLGDEIVEQGIFYVGMKHGRWEKFGKNFVLIDKTKYYKGWQRDAEITYHDPEQKKIKEVKPYKYATLNGTYYLFHENGQILEHGKYKDGVKIGLWVEYFENRNKRRKETLHPRDPYIEDQFEPYVLNEWDNDGNPLIRNGKKFQSPIKNQKRAPRKAPAKNNTRKAAPKAPKKDEVKPEEPKENKETNSESQKKEGNSPAPAVEEKNNESIKHLPLNHPDRKKANKIEQNPQENNQEDSKQESNSVAPLTEEENIDKLKHLPLNHPDRKKKELENIEPQPEIKSEEAKPDRTKYLPANHPDRKKSGQ